jgi:hypothetical protein
MIHVRAFLYRTRAGDRRDSRRRHDAPIELLCGAPAAEATIYDWLYRDALAAAKRGDHLERITCPECRRRVLSVKP